MKGESVTEEYYEKEIERLRNAIFAAVRGIYAELADQEQGPHETLSKIDSRIEELGEVLGVEP